MLAQGAYQVDSASERSKLGLAPTTASTPTVARAPAVEPASTPAVTPLTRSSQPGTPRIHCGEMTTWRVSGGALPRASLSM